MYNSSRQIAISSSLAALSALRSSFGSQVYLEQAELGITKLQVIVDNRSYFQKLGVPPDSRQYPSSSSLHNTPFFMCLQLIHPQNRHKVFQNGTVIDLFVGPSGRAETREDCTSAGVYSLGFRQLDSGVVILDNDLNARQRRLIYDIAPQLEEMLTAKQLVKK